MSRHLLLILVLLGASIATNAQPSAATLPPEGIVLSRPTDDATSLIKKREKEARQKPEIKKGPPRQASASDQSADQGGQATAESMNTEAQKELQLAPTDLSSATLPTPATVVSTVEPFQDPEIHSDLRFGLALEPFQPAGTMHLSNVAPYDLNALGTRPMVDVEGEWMPAQIQGFALSQAGVFASLGYAQHKVDLHAPTGANADDTTLHSVKAQLGAVGEFKFSHAPRWGVQAKVGLGRLETIQSSSASFANQTNSLIFGMLGLHVERAMTRNWNLFAGYEYDTSLRVLNEGAAIPANSFLLGFTGNMD